MLTGVSTLPTDHRRGQRVKVKANTVRGIWFTENGQRVEQWIPAGTYQIEGICSLADGDALAVWEVNTIPVHGYYIHPSAV